MDKTALSFTVVHKPSLYVTATMTSLR